MRGRSQIGWSVPRTRQVILAASGGYSPAQPWSVPALGPIFKYGLDLSGASRPKVGFLTTGVGDDPTIQMGLIRAAYDIGCKPTPISIFPKLNPPDAHEQLLAQDMIWVHGGSVANMLALWRTHRLDGTLKAALASGVIMAGTSAGSLCWHVGGTTRSFGLEPRLFDDGLAFVPHGNSVHLDSETERHELMANAVLQGVLPKSYCTQDGVALIYEDGLLVDTVADRESAHATCIELVSGKIAERRIEPRILTP